MKRWFQWWLLTFFPRTSTTRVANRIQRRFRYHEWEVTLTFRDRTEPDGYSREELVEMLEKIRKAESQMGWKVPEPDEK